MLFNSETGRSACLSRNGKARAAFWRAQGFPNLVRAREARWRGHVKKSEQKRQELEKARTPYALEKRPRGF
jgi:hypothetical protein